MGSLTALITTSLIVLIVLFIFGGLLRRFILIAKEYERFVIFRLGRSIGAKGPGLVILIPFIDTATKVDLREQFMEVPQQTAITKDNAPILVDFLTYWKVSDPERSVLQVGNFAAASQGTTSRWTTCWRSASASTKRCAASSTKSPNGGG
jgi:regulator of protease activity HflC (stomatin/prohibitin superfamily)